MCSLRIGIVGVNISFHIPFFTINRNGSPVRVSNTYSRCQLLARLFVYDGKLVVNWFGAGRDQEKKNTWRQRQFCFIQAGHLNGIFVMNGSCVIMRTPVVRYCFNLVNNLLKSDFIQSPYLNILNNLNIIAYQGRSAEYEPLMSFAQWEEYKSTKCFSRGEYKKPQSIENTG